MQDAVLGPFSTYIHMMEQTKRPTCSLVLPMVHKMLILLDPKKLVTVQDHENDTEREILVSYKLDWSSELPSGFMTAVIGLLSVVMCSAGGESASHCCNCAEEVVGGNDPAVHR